MKRHSFLGAVVALLVASPAWANPIPSVLLGFYGDAAGTVGVVYDQGPGALDIYVVVHNNDPVVAAGTVRFAAVPPPCFQGVYVGEISNYVVAEGNSQTGAWVWFLECSPGAYHVMTVSFAVQGLTSQCCWFEPQPVPGADRVEATDCSLGTLDWLSTEGLWINPNNPLTCTFPVEESTWGAVKALYR